MNQTTLIAIDLFFTTYEKIKKGEIPETKLNNLFLELSNYDYRNEHEKKVDEYVKIFLEGAYISEVVPSIERTARNSPTHREKRDIGHYCKYFLKEHFKYVRLAFWEKYKIKYKEIGKYSSAISPQQILFTIKEIENERRNKKKVK